MANPFASTSTTTATPINSSTDALMGETVPYTNNPIFNIKLKPGQFGIHYPTKTVYIGAYNPSDSNIPIISNENSFVQFLTGAVDENVSNKVPTSRAVRLELNKKADLTYSNQFTGMNEFPYLRVVDAAPSQLDIAVTIRMLKDYIEGEYSAINKLIEEAVAKLPGGGGSGSNSIFVKYVFNTPILEWDIKHKYNTISFSFIIKDNNNIQHEAPYDIINSNNFIIRFNEPISGTLLVTYYV